MADRTTVVVVLREQDERVVIDAAGEEPSIKSEGDDILELQWHEIDPIRLLNDIASDEMPDEVVFHGFVLQATGIEPRAFAFASTKEGLQEVPCGALGVPMVRYLGGGEIVVEDKIEADIYWDAWSKVMAAFEGRQE